MRYLALVILFISIYAHTQDIDAVVRIRTEAVIGSTLVTNHGTAWVLDVTSRGSQRKNLIVTAAHVANSGPKILVELKSSLGTRWIACKIVLASKTKDIALLEAEEDLPSSLNLSAVDPKILDNLVLCASPQGIDPESFPGLLIEIGGPEARMCVKFDHGCSGGPILNKEGKVVGLAVAGVALKSGVLNKDIALFVDLEDMVKFLDEALQFFKKH